MKIRCKNCYRVLNENEDYCTNCGEYSKEMAEYMKTGVRKVSLGEKFKISLIFFAFIAFLGTGIFSISSSMIQGFIQENAMLNVMSKLLTSMGLIIALAIVFRKDLYNIIFKDNLFVTLKDLVLGVCTMIIARFFAPSLKKDENILAEVSSLEESSIEIEDKKAKSNKVKEIIDASNNYKQMFKEEVFVLKTFKLFASIIVGLLSIAIIVILSTLVDFCKIIPTGLISFIPDGKVGVEFFELLFVLLLVSICEEYIYRHHLITFFDEETMLNDFWTITFSVIISTILSFAWFMSVEILLVTFIINIIMSLLYINTNRSLGVNIILRLLMYLSVLILNMYI